MAHPHGALTLLRMVF